MEHLKVKYSNFILEVKSSMYRWCV